MTLDLSSLKTNLNEFANECGLTIDEIGKLADQCYSTGEFKSKLDELCVQNTEKTSLEILGGFGVRFPDSKPRDEASSGENSALQNELVAVGEKIDELGERDKSRPQEAKT